MKMLGKMVAPVAALAVLGATALAEDVQHYAPEPSATFAEAVANFNEYNALMVEVLKADPMTVADMERVHELTYTIEIALAKMLETLETLPVTLEEVHLASEGDNPARLRGVAAVYLETAMELQ